MGLLEETSQVLNVAMMKSRYIIFLVCFFVILWTLKQYTHDDIKNMTSSSVNVLKSEVKLSSSQFIPPFSNIMAIPYSLTKQHCFEGYQSSSIEDLHKLVNFMKSKKIAQCQSQYNSFRSIFQIREKDTSIVITETFMTKVKKWLKSNEELIKATQNQKLIFVDNLWSSESVVFNPVRAKRPGGNADGSVKQYVSEIVAKAKDGCDFCAYDKFTARDKFGMLESLHSVAVSNTFKIEKYHGMILFKQHDPINFSQEQFIDAMDLAITWFDTTYKLVPNDNYRFMYWDILPKASASQLHPHIHLAVGDYAYYAKWNVLYKAGLQFAKETAKNYWTTLLEVHNSLGLAAEFGSASVMAYITPQKDFEVIVISHKPCLDFFRLVFFTIRTFMDDLEQYALSMGFVFPKRGTKYTDNGNELPMMVRIVSRGSADMARSDISSFDLFGTPNVNKDPFKVIESLRKSLKKWKTVKLNLHPRNF